MSNITPLRSSQSRQQLPMPRFRNGWGYPHGSPWIGNPPPWLGQVLSWRANGWRASCSPQGISRLTNLKSCYVDLFTFTFTWLSMFKARQCGNTVPNQRDKRMAMTSSSYINDSPRSGRRHHSIQATKKSEPGLFQCIVPQGLMCKLLDAELAVTRIQHGGWVWIVSQGIPGSQDPRIPGLHVHVFTSSWIRMDQDGSGTGARNDPKSRHLLGQWTQSPDRGEWPWPLSSDICASSLSREKTACNAKKIKMAAFFFQGTSFDLDLMTGDISMTSLIISI